MLTHLIYPPPPLPRAPPFPAITKQFTHAGPEKAGLGKVSAAHLAERAAANCAPERVVRAHIARKEPSAFGWLAMCQARR